MVPMSSDNPTVLYNEILHIRISQSRECSVSADHLSLTLSQGAFRNDGATLYHSPALDAIGKSQEKWLFFDWWTGSWAENAVRFPLRDLILSNDPMEAALFDEPLGEDGVLLLSSESSGLLYDAYGNIPSSLLIRRDVFQKLLDTVFTLFPYPVQKLTEAAIKAGVEVSVIPGMDVKTACNLPYQLIPFQGKGLLRGKNRTGKRLLVITHDLNWGGAPIVLSEACINVLKPAGYELAVLSLKDGPLAEKFRENGISVMVTPEVALQDSTLLLSLVQPYDAVIVNTIVPYAGIHLLNSLKKPVLWWIHESELVYQAVGMHLPEHLAENIHVCCVGQLALNMLKKYRNYPADSLIYGLRDSNPFGKFWKPDPTKQRLVFATVGSVLELKGQDILMEAISLLEDTTRDKCEFLLVGKTEDPKILDCIRRTEEKYPENVRYIGLVPRNYLDEIYQNVDCIICSSRQDCMPTFVSEGLMYGRTAICSENTGTAPVLQKEQAGFTYGNNDPAALAAAITAYVSLSDEERENYGKRARACFENNFSMDVFRDNLLKTMEEIMA